MKLTPGHNIVNNWLALKGRKPFAFQQETWQHILDGKSGLVNAPTGFGKTYSVFLGAVIKFINDHPSDYQTKKNNGLQLVWITPLRALAKDIGRAMEEVIAALGLGWKLGIRNGDTSMSDRAKQKRQMPEVLIITPESLMLMLAMKDHPAFFKTLQIVAIDEWHELIGSKRGVQVELALSRLVGICNSRYGLLEPEAPQLLQVPKKVALNHPAPTPATAATNSNLCIWGISATIGNLEEAKQVLLSCLKPYQKPHNTQASSAQKIKNAHVTTVDSSKKNQEVDVAFFAEVLTPPRDRRCK